MSKPYSMYWADWILLMVWMERKQSEGIVSTGDGKKKERRRGCVKRKADIGLVLCFDLGGLNRRPQNGMGMR